MKRALICGVSGQDGSYLAKLLLEKGYEVIGTSRDVMITNYGNLDRLGVVKDVEKTSMAINDFSSVISTIRSYKPDEIYNLAGQTSVALSFEYPVETMESIAGGTLNLLEALRSVDRPIRFYNAGSSECFGDTVAEGATENTSFNPRSPYATAKASAYWLLKNYREAYDIYACTGILFNHESPLRPERFVTKKIVSAAKRIANGSGEKLVLGTLDIYRDWGYAGDYIEAMHAILLQDKPDDYVVASGRSHSLEEFVRLVFEKYNLNWTQHVILSEEFSRPSDIKYSCGNANKAKEVLGWVAKTEFRDLIDILTDHDC